MDLLGRSDPRRFLGLVIMILFVLLSLPTKAISVCKLEVIPSHVEIITEESFSLRFELSKVEDLAGFQFGISFDPKVIEVSSIDVDQEGPFKGIDSTFVPTKIDNEKGELIFARIITPTGEDYKGIDGSGSLVVLKIKGKKEGSTELKFTDILLANSLANVIDCQVISAKIDVLPKPIKAPTKIEGLSDLSGQPGQTLNIEVVLVKDEDPSEPLADKELSFLINNEKISTQKTQQDGKATFSFTIPENAKDGDEFSVKIEFAGDKEYEPSFSTAKIKVYVVKTPTSLKIGSFEGVQGETVKILAELKTKDEPSVPIEGEEIKFYLGDLGSIGSAKTDSKGCATLSYLIPKDLNPQPYEIRGEFEGSDKYEGCEGFGSLKVKPTAKPTAIKVYDVEAEAGSKVELKALLTTMEDPPSGIGGKDLVFKIGEVVLSAKTSDQQDRVGEAVCEYTIPIDAEGVIHFVVSFKGDDDFAGSQGKGQIKIVPTTMLIFKPSQLELQKGDSETVELYLKHAKDLYGYQLRFKFNPQLVEIEKIEGTFYDPENPENFFEVGPKIDNKNGQADYTRTLSNPAKPQSGKLLMLATIDVKVTGEGEGSIVLDDDFTKLLNKDVKEIPCKLGMLKIKAKVCYPPVIEHTPLTSPQGEGPYKIVATIKDQDGDLDKESLKVSYTTDGGSSWRDIKLTQTTKPDEYQAQIPDQEDGTKVGYYIIAKDKKHRVRHPKEEGSYHEFTVSKEMKIIQVFTAPEKLNILGEEEFDIEVVVDEAEDLWGFSFDVVFDKDVLEFVKGQEGDFLKNNPDNAETMGFITLKDGRVDVSYAIKGEHPGASGKGTLCKLTFKCKDVTKLPTTIKVEPKLDGFRDSKNQIISVEVTGHTLIERKIPGDFNYDGFVDYKDLFIFAAHWLHNEDSPCWKEKCSRCNIDKTPSADGKQTIDYRDLFIFAANWHKGTPPAAKTASILAFAKKDKPSLAVDVDSETEEIDAEKTVGVGDVVKIAVVVKDVKDLFGFNFNLRFDPTILKFIKAEEGPFLKQDGTMTLPMSGLIDEKKAIFNAANARAGATVGISGSGVIFFVEFEVLKRGTSSIDLVGELVLQTKGLEDPEGRIVLDPQDPDDVSNGKIIIPLPPKKPTDLKAETLSSSEIKLTWKDNSDNEKGFKVYYKKKEDPDFSHDDVDKDATEHIVSGLRSDTVYEFKVRAYNDAGESEDSNLVQARTEKIVYQEAVLKVVAPSKISVGSEFVADIVIGDKDNEILDLSSISFVLTYEPKDSILVRYKDIKVGKFFKNDPFFVRACDPDKGTISISISLKGKEGVSGWGTVCRIKFRVSDTAKVEEGVKLSITDATACTVNSDPIILTPQPHTLSLSKIYIKPSVSEVLQPRGGKFTLDINLDKVENLLGVSFVLRFDQPDKVKVASPTNENILPGELLGLDAIFFARVDEETGKVEATCVRRITQGGVSGEGRVAYVNFSLSKDLPVGEKVKFEIVKVKAYTQEGLVLGILGDTCEIEIKEAGIPVWPGDTNNDGTVNGMDVFAIARHWKLEGPQRTDATLEWEEQFCDPWDPEDATYADVDGNGKIEAMDVLGIGLNWNKTHKIKESESSSAIRFKIIDHSKHVNIYKQMLAVLKEFNLKHPGISELKKVLDQYIEEGIRCVVPPQTQLLQNFPNPFNPETWIPYRLSETGQVLIKIYNLSGQLIKTLDEGIKTPGTYTTKQQAAYWDGRNEQGQEVSSGIYIYQLIVNGKTYSRRMVVLK